MKIVLVIYKFFSGGGTQRDLARIAGILLERNISVELLCANLSDPPPEGCSVSILGMQGKSNHARMKNFEAAVKRYLEKNPPDAVLGFGRMAWLDLYFAGDDCLLSRWKNRCLNILLPRRRIFLAMEKAALQSPMIFTLTARQERDYQFYYHTAPERFKRMPPGIDRKYQTFERTPLLRKQVREKYNIAQDRIMIIQTAASYRTKGVDRSFYMISKLPEDLKKRITLLVAGDDRRRQQYAKVAEMHNIDVRLPGGCNNLEELYSAADLMLHPARNEATGTVLIEALCCNLPVLTTERCGYAEYIKASGGGVVLPEPFTAEHWILALKKLLTEPEHLIQCRKNTCNMYKNDFWYSRPAVMADEVIKFAEQKRQRNCEKTLFK